MGLVGFKDCFQIIFSKTKFSNAKLRQKSRGRKLVMESKAKSVAFEVGLGRSKEGLFVESGGELW